MRSPDLPPPPPSSPGVERYFAGRTSYLAGFVPLAEVDALPLDEESRVFFRRAVEMRSG